MGVCSGKGTLSYESSPRMKPRPEEPTLSYPSKLERIVESVSNLEQRMERTALEDYIIERVGEWFEEPQEDRDPKKPPIIVKLEFLERRIRPKVKALEYKQLVNVDQLNLLFKCFERDFCVTESLNNIIAEFELCKEKRHKFYNGNTIRKQQQFYHYKLDDPEQALVIYEKVACSVYAVFLRKQLAGENEEMNSFISAFHDKVGLKLFSFLKFKKITADQLLFVIYHLLMVNSSRLKPQEKIPLIKQNLGKIRDLFQRMFIQEQYTYHISEKQLKNIRAISASYLDNLFRKSQAQIDNPAITDNEQSVRPMFIFPVNTVKSRNKKY